MKTLRALLRSRSLAVAVVLAGALAYPVAVLSGGWPRFPSKQDCSTPATRDGNVVLVLGILDSTVQANQFLDRVKAMGYVHADVQGDGCERVKVFVPGYTTIADARNAAAEAARAGLHATVEQG